MNRKFDLTTLVRKNVANLKPYSSARDEFQSVGKEMVFLDANENPFQTDVNRYPDPQQKTLKAAIAKIKGVPQDTILLGNGSDEVLDLLFRAFCEPKKDNVITLPPTYGMYAVLANINDVENREIILTPDFEPNISRILSAVDRHSKIIFLCFPNNPTGNSFSEESVLDLLEHFNGLVVIDEAYIDFSTKESWVQRLKAFPNLVVTQTLSKAYGMAGIRLGVCYASTEITSVLNKIKPPYNVNELSQLRALNRIDNLEKVKDEVLEILEERARLLQVLRKVSYILKIYESDANFILIKVDDATKRYTELLEMGIVVRNRTNQPLCENTLRLTVGIPEENDRLVKALMSLN